MTKLSRTIFLVSIFFLVWQNAFSYEETGMLFRSHEVRPDKRTSLSLAEASGDGITFTKSCDLFFDVRIDNEKERFGYICRAVIDAEESVDVILSTPYSGLPYIGVATGKAEFKPVNFSGNADLGEWHNINIKITSEKSSVTVVVNGEIVFTKTSKQRNHSALLYWGAVSEGKFSTSDVAPMSVKNISLKIDGRRPVTWPLSSADEFESVRKVRMTSENPVWLSDFNRHWQTVRELTFDSKVFTVPDHKNCRLFIITKTKIIRYDLVSGRCEEWSARDDYLKLDYCTDSFYALPDGRLVYVDFEQALPVVSEFLPDSGVWTRASSRTKVSRYLHSNNVYNPVDTSCVQLFGYGYHKYSNEVDVLGLVSGEFVRKEMEMPPRYLAATGICGNSMYIYGGKGNDNGAQELGVKIYCDLRIMSLEDYHIEYCWSLPGDNCVAASDLVVSDDGQYFWALVYNPNVFPTSLRLRRISAVDGSFESFADEFRYDFIDVESDAGLMLSKESDAFFAYMSSRAESDKFIVRILRVNNPVLRSECDMISGKSSSGSAMKSPFLVFLIICMSIAAILIVAGIYMFSRKREPQEDCSDEASRESCPQSADSSAMTLSAGVYLIGGFKVVNRNNEDISGSFTPLMKQLLALIVLYSDKSGGISNVELKEILWDDKSNESFSNNRGVNFKKIRTCLAEVGNIDLVSNHGKWCLSDKDGLCDWLRFSILLGTFRPGSSSPEEVENFLQSAGRGQLLPEMRYEWLDSFKAKYTEDVINILTVLRDSAGASPDMRIRIADLILTFDSLDEDSVSVKCKSYIQMKRLGSAQKVFTNFAEEYKAVMGEPFALSFQDFIRKN
ncbi:MAG: hypothetical protein PUA96_06675 [Bacteroidales bacterium]|nr:hypothetical protein [Bacteroidales bacterium]